MIAADWAYGSSAVHRRDARVKIVTTLALLIAITTAGARDWPVPATFAALLLAAAPACGLPALPVALRALSVSAFPLPFALLLAWQGRPIEGLALWLRAFACGVAILLLAGTTRLPELMHALRWFRMPALLAEVIHFVYRYLFLAAGRAQRMRTAAAARGGASFRSAGALLAVLFARSYQRAEHIHRAMLSRGYNGSLVHAPPAPPSFADAFFGTFVVAAAAAVRWAASHAK